MEFDALLKMVGDDPLFESALLLAGKVDPKLIRLQLTRWVRAGAVSRFAMTDSRSIDHIFSDKSIQSGFKLLINSIFLCLDPPLICFSRRIAALISVVTS